MEQEQTQNVETTEVVKDTEQEEINNEPNTDELKQEVKEEKQKELMIPKNRFDEINNKYKEINSKHEELLKRTQELEKQLQEINALKEKEVTEKTKQFEELSSKLDNYQKTFKEMVNAKIETMPEVLRELVPDHLTDEQKLEWLTKAEQKGLFNKPIIEVGKPLNHSSDMNQTERLKKMNPLQALANFYANN